MSQDCVAVAHTISLSFNRNMNFRLKLTKIVETANIFKKAENVLK